MRDKLLEIHWEKDVIELVRIPGHNEKQLTTLERWKGSRIGRVFYVARIERAQLGTKVNVLILEYRADDQPEEMRKIAERFEIRWGTSTIKWKTGADKGSAEWVDNEGPNKSGPADEVNVLGRHAPELEFRKSVLVRTKLRPKQQLLRDQLLCAYGECALTGEREKTAIEAAHVIPVKDEGQEDFNNALLLRADLHRLFDAGLIWFDVAASRAAVRYADELSANYKGILEGKTIPNDVFEQIRPALLKRAQLPDGAGLGGDKDNW